jgi:hypothetical protein
MKKLTVILIISLCVGRMGWAAAKPLANEPRIQLAILLDTSGSMDGLINQAKSRLWKIVNELATAKKNGRLPQLQVALYEYGQDSLSADSGYMRQIVPLTRDLDRVSEELFKLKTNGGEEYCGQVIQKAVAALRWSKQQDDLKLIFIAGNEPFTQGSVDYKNSCRDAIRQGIVVNTVFCGNYQEGLQTDWKAGADLADGQYLSIDANQSVMEVAAPQDGEILALNSELNQTYLAYGDKGLAGKERQMEQDKNAAGMSGAVPAQRAAAKASAQYSNESWDLLDAQKKGRVKLEEMKESELPQEMKNMSLKERQDYLAAAQKKREATQARITELSRARQQYIDSQLKINAAENTLDAAIVKVLRQQAAARNFSFEKTASK